MRFTTNTQHDTSEVLRLRRKMAMEFSKVLRLLRKWELICKRRKSATQNGFQHLMKHVGMSQSAATATWNEATRRLKPPQVTTLTELRPERPFCPHNDRSQPVADGCGRSRTPKQSWANTSHPPDPQSKTRTLRYAFGKKQKLSSSFQVWIHSPAAQLLQVTNQTKKKTKETTCDLSCSSTPKLKRKVQRVECTVWSVEFEVWSVGCKV